VAVSIAKGWRYGLAVSLLYLLLLLLIKKNELSPQNMQFVRQGYAKRKADFTAALMVLGDEFRKHNLSDDSKDKIRGYALGLISSYVRGHRSDTKEVKIFASLLVEQTDTIRVLHRSSTGKAVHDESFLKTTMLATRAFAESQVVWSGDIKSDYPDTAVGKSYNSVMVVPIFPVNSPSANPRPIGAVSIVSSEPYHFDTYTDELETHLMPYVKLLSITLC
jgi:hypothetical protein